MTIRCLVVLGVSHVGRCGRRLVIRNLDGNEPLADELAASDSADRQARLGGVDDADMDRIEGHGFRLLRVGRYG